MFTSCVRPLFNVCVYVEFTPRNKPWVFLYPFRWDDSSAPGQRGRCLLFVELELRRLKSFFAVSFGIHKKTPTKEQRENQISKVTTAWKLNRSIIFIRHILFHCCNTVLLRIPRTLYDNNRGLRSNSASHVILASLAALANKLSQQC